MNYDAATFEDFWQEYQTLHSRRATQVMHAVASLAFVSVVTTAVVLRRPWLLALAPVADFVIAQTSHRLFERNRTTPWRNPLWHARAELRLLRRTLLALSDARIGASPSPSRGRGAGASSCERCSESR